MSQDSNTKGYFQALRESVWKSTELCVCVVRAWSQDLVSLILNYQEGSETQDRIQNAD